MHGMARGRLSGLLAVVSTALLSACVDGPEMRRPTPRVSAAPAPRPPSVAFRQCAARLDALSVAYTRLPDQNRGGGCFLDDAVRLDRIAVPASNLGPMTCPLAEKFAAWARYAVAPAARLHLGSEVVRIETFGTYACRNIVGNAGMAGKRSEHAHGNAVDVSAFVLADGRRITLADDWTRQGGPSRRFLDAVHASACKRFRTVLGPDYNAAHYNHFHFDMGGRGGYCR